MKTIQEAPQQEKVEPLPGVVIEQREKSITTICFGTSSPRKTSTPLDRGAHCADETSWPIGIVVMHLRIRRDRLRFECHRELQTPWAWTKKTTCEGIRASITETMPHTETMPTSDRTERIPTPGCSIMNCSWGPPIHPIKHQHTSRSQVLGVITTKAHL